MFEYKKVGLNRFKTKIDFFRMTNNCTPDLKILIYFTFQRGYIIKKKKLKVKREQQPI